MLWFANTKKISLSCLLFSIFRFVVCRLAINYCALCYLLFFTFQVCRLATKQTGNFDYMTSMFDSLPSKLIDDECDRVIALFY